MTLMDLEVKVPALRYAGKATHNCSLDKRMSRTS